MKVGVIAVLLFAAHFAVEAMLAYMGFYLIKDHWDLFSWKMGWRADHPSQQDNHD